MKKDITILATAGVVLFLLLSVFDYLQNGTFNWANNLLQAFFSVIVIKILMSIFSSKKGK